MNKRRNYYLERATHKKQKQARLIVKCYSVSDNQKKHYSGLLRLFGTDLYLLGKIKTASYFGFSPRKNYAIY